MLCFLGFRTFGDLEVHSGSRPPERTSRTLDRHARTPRCAGQSVRVQLGVPFAAKLDKAKEIMIMKMKICIKMRLDMLTCYESSSFEERQWSETCLEIEQGRGPIRLRSRKSIKHESGPGHCLQKIIAKAKL